MKSNVIKDLSPSELQEKLAEQTEQLNKLKMNHAVSPLENPLKIRSARRVVARIKTEINKRAKASK